MKYCFPAGKGIKDNSLLIMSSVSPQVLPMGFSLVNPLGVQTSGSIPWVNP
jgi:hypothetical protein